MAHRTGRAKQSYNAALFNLAELASAADGPAVAALLKKDAAGQLETIMSGPGRLGLTTIRDFDVQGPPLVLAHGAACTNVLRLLQKTLNSGSSSSSGDATISTAALHSMAHASSLLMQLGMLVESWFQVLSGTAHNTSEESLDNLENTSVVPILNQTGLIPRLGSTAALLTPLVASIRSSAPPSSSSASGTRSSSSSRSGSSKGQTGQAQAAAQPVLTRAAEAQVANTAHALLFVWSIMVACDNQGEGFSVCDPQCLAALPAVCGLVRAMLCAMPFARHVVAGLGGAGMEQQAFMTCHGVANFASGHLHMQYCKAFAGLTSPREGCSRVSPDSITHGINDPERGCSRATAHMLARSEDYQWVQLAFLAIEFEATHRFTKGGTEIQELIPGLSPNLAGVTPQAIAQALTKKLKQEGKEQQFGGLFESLSGLAGEDDGPFSNSRKPVAPMHQQLLSALGLGGLSSGCLHKWAHPPSPVDRGLARIGLWSVEHQFLQVNMAEPGRVGMPCGAHGPLLGALCEYLVTVGPMSEHFHACLPVARHVVNDYADKLASGSLPLLQPAGAAAAGGDATADAPAGQEEEGDQLDPGMVHGLAALLAVGVPACVPNARKKETAQFFTNMMEPSLLPVQKMSQDEWAGWLLRQLWGILDTLMDLPAANEMLAAALWQQPATAAASLEWLIRHGPLQPPTPQQQTNRATIRLLRRLTAACAAPPSPAAAKAAAASGKAQASLADLLLSLLKRLKQITQQQQQQQLQGAPPAAYRATADIAAAAAVLGAAAASTPIKTKQGSSSSGSCKGKGAAAAAGASSSGDRASVKHGPALWAVVAGHSLWWLGSQLPVALDLSGASSSGSSSEWVAGDVPDQMLGTFKAVSQSLAWLAATLPGLSAVTDPTGVLAGSAAWAALWNSLQQQGMAEAQAAVQAAIEALRQVTGAAVGSSGGVQWQEAVKGACAALAAVGARLCELLPCGMCCNRPECCQLAAESEHCSVESDKGVLMRCSGCRAAHYCCRRCQKLAWPGHKQACKLSAPAPA